MAEAVAALGLAANILQVTDYGIQFVSIAWKVWRSGHEGVDAIATLHTLSQDLKNVTVQLQADSTSSQTDRLAASDRGIFEAAVECGKAAQEILDSLDRILPPSSRKRDAAKNAFRLVWKEGDIKALQARLEGVRNQLTLNLAASLRWVVDAD